jgi:hypothetical protein
MSIGKIGRSRTVIDTRRARQTPRPQNTFKQVLNGGAQVLLSGAQIATSAVGLPTLSAAIGTARSNIGTSSGVNVGTNGQPGNPADTMEALQKQRMEDDLKLLALQSRIQQENRQVALVSNVMKAKHDTAKSAIGNIRA